MELDLCAPIRFFDISGDGGYAGGSGCCACGSSGEDSRRTAAAAAETPGGGPNGFGFVFSEERLIPGGTI